VSTTVLDVETEDDGFVKKELPKEVRPLHWIPGAGLLPADFFLPGLA